MDKFEEPEVIYGRYNPQLADPGTIVFTAQKGVAATIFDDVVALYGHSQYMAEVLDLNLKTIQKYKTQHIPLSPARSELMLKLVALFKKGAMIFGSKKAFIDWLECPAIGIDHRLPMDLLRTSGGIELVEEELDRIQYGDTA